MENIISLDVLSTLMVGQAFLQYLLDLLFKSSLIVGLTYLIATLLRGNLSNNSSHLLWLNCLLCVAFLPFAAAILSVFSAGLLDSGPITVIKVLPSSTVAAAATTTVSTDILAASLYGAIAGLLLLKLGFSALALKRINDSAFYCTEKMIIQLAQKIAVELEVSRTVTVKFSEEIASPMSFGLLRPVVMLPSVAATWDESTIEDVMLHELSHIKRLDWSTMLFCHLLSSVFWINPLVWLAKNRVNETAEQACDAAVLRYGKDGIGYAEDLLRLARESLPNSRAPILAQLMFDESSLSLRIRNILDGSLIGKASKAFITSLMFSAILLVSACSGINLFGSNELDQEFLPTKALAPQYPTRAAEQGITGWTLVSFTVTENGLVDENTLKVVDAEPAEIFDRTSIRAAAKFEFEPRIRNGKAVSVEGVQYVFRYELEEGGNQGFEQRSPPEARSSKDRRQS